MSTASFASLMASHESRLRRAAFGYLGNTEEAQEATQESMLKAFRARDRYDRSKPFYPWAYRILRNTCLDLLARRRHAALPGLDSERVGSDRPGADVLLDKAQQRQRLWASMQRLKADHQEILNMRHFQDLSYAEIGEILDLAPGTVMSRLFRARRALAAEMRKEDR